MTLRVAIDGGNLANDRRGMGRYARGAIAHMQSEGVALRFVTDDAAAARILREEFGRESVVSQRSARMRGAYDAAWYPFNGMRFRCAAPALVTMHDAFAFDEPARDIVARWREQQPMRRAAHYARAIHTDSHWSETRLRAALSLEPERVDVVPLAPEAVFAPDPTDSPSPLTGPYVLFVGGRETRKNAAFFIRAYADAFTSSGDIRLAIVGELHADAERALAERPIHHMRLRPSDAELRSLYRHARAVAVPSLGEGFGLVAVEAQACGAPVLAADASALPEAVGDAGLLVAPTDRAGWSAALARIVRDDSLNADLRARGIARWANDPRDRAARSVLATLRTLARNGSAHERA